MPVIAVPSTEEDAAVMVGVVVNASEKLALNVALEALPPVVSVGVGPPAPGVTVMAAWLTS